MKYLPLIWAALWRKPLRTTLTTLAMVVAFTLFGLMQAINAGFDALTEAARPDGLRVSSEFGSPLPLAYKQQIEKLPGVRIVTPVLGFGGPVNGDMKMGLSINFAQDGFFEFYRWLNVTPAQAAEWRANRTGIVIGIVTAERLGVKVGERINIRGMPRKDGTADWAFDVLAIVDRKDMPHTATVSVGNYEYINEDRSANQNMVGQFYVLLEDPDMDAAIRMAQVIDATFANSPAGTRTTIDRQEAENRTEDSNFPEMANNIVISTLGALFLLTFSSMLQAFRERIPEFGTLKALGFTDRGVFGLVLAESLTMCLLGGAVGLVIAKVAVPYAKTINPQFNFANVPLSLIGLGLLAAAIIALISAALPAWRAGRMQIVDALAGR